MAKHSKRVGNLEGGEGPPPTVLVHVFPGENTADAIAAYQRERGPIPADARVIVILHSFRSAI